MLNCDFEVVSRFADAGLNLPERKTEYSAGYDLIAAEDIVIPSMFNMVDEVMENLTFEIKPNEYLTLETMAELTKQADYRPTLVSTGMKCKLDPGTWLQLSVRSSSPLKYWLMLANGVGVIDADYYNNLDDDDLGDDSADDDLEK